LQASNERDYIYGLLGLLEDHEKVGITIDYDKDWRQVYVDLARMMISRGNVDLLALGQKSEFDSIENIPSWTPDWRYDIWSEKDKKKVVRNLKLPFVAIGAPLAEPFSASGAITMHSTVLSASPNSNFQTWSPGRSVLDQILPMVLQGFLVDRIEKTGKLCIPMDTPGSDSLGNMTRYISDISIFCRDSAQLNRKNAIYTSQQLREAPWRVPIRDLEVAGKSRLLGLLPDKATPLSYVRYRGLTHMLRAFEAYQAFEKTGATSTSTPQHKIPILSTMWSMIVKSTLLAKSIYHLARFWLQRQKYLAKSILWVYNKLRYLLIHTVILLGLASRDAASTLNAKIEQSWHDLDETKGEIYVYTLTTNHSIKPLMTKNGYVGVGTEFLMKGDMICILKGGTVPFVLRPRGEGREGYWVVGEAFVYGIMGGEFVKGKGEDEMESFALY
jgi:hypothetical protein